MRPPVRLDIAQSRALTYRLTAPHGTALDEVLQPEFWVHVASSLKVGYRVEVMAEDATWFADLLVRSVEKKTVLMGVMNHINFSPDAVAVTDDGPLYVKFRGPRKFSVIRRSDDEILREEIGTKEEAVAWMADHLAKMAS